MPWMPRSHYDRAYREEGRRQSRKRYDREVRPAHLRAFYSSLAWTRLSLAHRQAHPVCQRCRTRLSAHTHHRQKITTPAGWDARLDPEGLLALCVGCHEEVEE